MKTDTLATLIVVAIALAIMVAFFAISFALSRAKCDSQWKRSGHAAEWSVLQGCIVQRKDGTWIPAENMREVN